MGIGDTISNSDKLLNNDFIINNLTDILNSRPISVEFIVKKYPGYEYEYKIVPNKIDPNFSEYCLIIKFIKLDKNKVSIYVDQLIKCSSINNFGNFFIESLKEFANKFGYYSIIIGNDISSLDFIYPEKNNSIVEINLSALNILIFGESWYNKMGFYNTDNLDEIEFNRYIINKPISDFYDSENIITLIDDAINMRNNKSDFFHQFKKTINSYGKFNEILNLIFDITNKTEDDKIKDIFKSIYDYIREHCDNKTKICDVDYEIMKKISSFINFMYMLLELKYTNRHLVYYAKKINANQSAGKRKKIKNKNKTYRKYLNKMLNKKHKSTKRH
jgi:hypothetical protein